MAEDPTNLERDLDSYSAGEMTADERARLERAAPEAVAAERALRAALRSAYAPPPPPDLPPVDARPAWPVARWAVGVVAVVAAVVGVWAWRGPSDRGDPTWAAYERRVASGFAPDGAERDPGRLAAALSEKLGRSVRIDDASDAGIEWLGLASAPGGTPLRVQLLARVDGRPVVAYVDVAGPGDADWPGSPPSGLRLFQRRRAGLEFVEVTPLPGPRVTPLIVPVDRPRDAKP